MIIFPHFTSVIPDWHFNHKLIWFHRLSWFYWWSFQLRQRINEVCKLRDGVAVNCFSWTRINPLSVLLSNNFDKREKTFLNNVSQRRTTYEANIGITYSCSKQCIHWRSLCLNACTQSKYRPCELFCRKFMRIFSEGDGYNCYIQLTHLDILPQSSS